MFKSNKLLYLIFVAVGMFYSSPVWAVCPVCAVTVGAGVGFSRWLGVDDTITGVWIGGLTVSMIIWTLNWLDKRGVSFKGKKLLTALLYYSAIIVPLYLKGIIGAPYNTFCGCDKLVFGIAAGSLAFLLAVLSYDYLKKKNGGRAYFPFQKVVMPVGILIITSIVFYYLTK
jgi:hypothetical protein